MTIDFIPGVLVHVGCGGRIGSLPGQNYGEGLAPEDPARNGCDRCGKVAPWEDGETAWVYNLRHNADIAGVPGVVYVGRGMPRLGLAHSAWANPYTIKVAGSQEAALQRFKVVLRDWLAAWPDYLQPLRGRALACWCVPEPCHSELVLAKLRWKE